MKPQSSATAKGNTVKNLILPTLRNYLLATVAFAIPVFISAWTLAYWQAWVFIVIVMLSLSVSVIYFSIKEPALVERRQEISPRAEQSIAQKIIISIALLGGIALLVFAGLDHRFGWSRLPAFVSVVGDGLVAFSFLVKYFVFRENSFAASSIRTFEGQKVISTGPYALVRHPQYVSDIILFAGIPLALGSWWGLAFLALLIPLFALRILDEEKLLKKDLPGYTEYIRKVQYRLVPYLW